MITLRGPAPIYFMQSFIADSMQRGIKIDEPEEELKNAIMIKNNALILLQKEYKIVSGSECAMKGAFAR